MSYAVSKDCRGRFVYSTRRRSKLRQQRSVATLLTTKIPLGEWDVAGTGAAPSRAPVKVWVHRNAELKQPESHLGGEYDEWMAESI